MSDQTDDALEEDAEANPLDRFIWDSPLIPIGPDEVYVPATIEELRAGIPGRIIKDPNLTQAEPAMVASADQAQAAAKDRARSDHPAASRWRS